MSEEVPTSDAQPSNSGDRYHFVFAGRRMLGMLRPGASLQLLEMEGVAREDREFAEGPDTFLGVDLAEYHGGTSSAAAEKVVIVQVKYSPVHPTQAWSLARLTRNRTGSNGRPRKGTSVLRKLTRAFEAIHSTRADAPAGWLIVRLHTNQPLSSELKGELLRLHNIVLQAGDATAGGKLLKADQSAVSERLKEETALSWTKLAAFLLAWDLDGFGQAMLSTAEAELFAEVDRYADGGVMVGNLISFVQEHAQFERPTAITKAKVYSLLRLREEDFFPAPSPPGDWQKLILTRDAENLLSEMASYSGTYLMVTGRGGSGKSSAMRIVARGYAGGDATVIYDCFAGGAGLTAGSERFPYTVCFVQIINELEAQFHTGVLATTRLPYATLMRRFREALNVASSVAAARGDRLVIAFDAIDNAADEAERSSVRGDESFVPLLWRIEWPANCLVLLSSRSENVHRLKLPKGVQVSEITGFTEEETERHVAAVLPRALDLVPDLVPALHEGTGGNPRVQTAVLEDIAVRSVGNPLAFIRERARQSAFEYYRDECPRRINLATDRLLLAVLREATQFVSINTLSEVVGRARDEVEFVVRELYFGLRVNANDEITWRDQEFLDFVSEFVAQEQQQARVLLSDYCLSNQTRSAYARKNLARHLHMAGRHEELLHWCLDEGNLEARMREVEPHGEDVLDEIEYALKSAAELESSLSALLLLAVAAEILQGRDLFVEKLWDALPAALGSGYLERLLDDLAGDAADPETAHRQLLLGSALAVQGEQIDIADDLMNRGIDALSFESQRERPRTDFNDDDFRAITEAHGARLALRDALARLGEWEPRELVAPLYSVVTQAWKEERDPDPISAIRDGVPEPQARAYAFMGLLAGATSIPDSVARDAVGELVAIEATERLPLGEFAEALVSLMRSGHLDLTRQLLPKFKPAPPTYTFDQRVDEFLLERALAVALGTDGFDPAGFPATSAEEQSKRDADDARQLQRTVAQHFPARLALARALARAPSDEVRSAINEALRRWKGDLYYPGRDRATSPGDLLVRALVALGGYDAELLQALLKTAERMESEPLLAYARYAQVLAREPRYQADAERLIMDVRRRYRPPRARAEDAVELFLKLHSAASAFDPDLAAELFVDARLLATELDAEISGRSLALLRALERSGVDSVDDQDLVNLVRVYSYMSEAQGHDRTVPQERLLRLLARTRPTVAFWAASQWENENSLQPQESSVALAEGLLDADGTTGGAAWPLLRMASPWHNLSRLYQQSTARIAATSGDPTPPLAAYGQFTRSTVTRERRAEKASEMARWAESLGLRDHPEVERVHQYGEALTRLGLGEQENALSGSGSVRHVPLVTRAREAFERSPAEAVAVLQGATDKDLRQLHRSDLEDLFLSLSFPTVQLLSLLPLIERWDTVSEAGDGIQVVLVMVGGNPPDRLAAAARETMEGMFTPRSLEYFVGRREFDPKFLGVRHPAFAGPEGFAFLANATTRQLRALSSETLHRTIGLLSELLSAADAATLFRAMLGRAVSRMPIPLVELRGRPWETPHPQAHFLCDLLGHPNSETRWYATYALADLCLFGPVDTLDGVMRELTDTSHPRWMTKQEWISFLLEHLALRDPEMLAPHAGEMFAVATNAAFPHAKIRHHLREALRHVEAAQPGTLTPSEVQQLRRLNRPRKFVRGKRPPRIRPQQSGRWDREASRAFTFDRTDTIPYWYQPLNNCFVEPPRSVEEIAYHWIVDRWGITDELCGEDRRTRNAEWPATSNSHGGQPTVESLHIYAERHGMYMAAGELVETAPVLYRNKREGDEWSEWVRDQLRLADPALPGRWVDGPPAVADNFGIFSSAFEQWRDGVEEADYLAELHPAGDTNWIVVAGHREGTFGERRFTSRVWSALVTSDSSDALRRSYLAHEKDLPELPSVDLSHDVTWPEHEFDLDHRSDYYIVTRGEIVDRKSQCELRCWLARFYQEFEVESTDPRLPKRSRNWATFTTDVVRTLGLTRRPASPHWYDAEGRLAAYVEVWSDTTDRSAYADTAEGSRLVLRHDLVAELARLRGADILFSVNWTRNRSSRYSQRSSDEQKQRGSHGYRLYLFNTESGWR